MKHKQQIRQEALAKRDALSHDLRAQASADLVQFASQFGNVSSMTIGGYWAINSELDPQQILKALANKGARLALPAVVTQTQIEFRAYAVGDDLVDGGFGTKAPNVDAGIVTPDILLMPLSAVDLQGNRIGYGAGHYDRYIAAQKTRPKLIGLAFEEQIFDNIQAEAHDQVLDGIWTPQRIIWRS